MKSKPQFLQSLDERVLIFDGAMGTTLHGLDLTLDDYEGHENCVDVLSATRPDVIESVHSAYLRVGCDAVETNTFGANAVVLAEFGIADRSYELNLKSAQIARRVADQFSTPQWPRFVAGSVGPGTKLITLRQIAYDELFASYHEQIRGLLDGGVDVVIIETCQDILQAKTAIYAAAQAFERCARRVPLIAQVTMETTGTMLVGTDIAAAMTAIEAFPEVDVIGLNCATGPQEMSEHIRHLSRYCTRRLSVMPNAGLPQLVNGRPHFPLSPEELARWLKEFVSVDGVSIVGGCCGTTPVHMAAVVKELRSPAREVEAGTGRTSSAALRPAPGQQAAAGAPRHESAVSSLYQAEPLRQDNSFLIIGERCNTNGSRQFKRLLAEGDLEGLTQIAREQAEEGAHVLDVCVDYVGRDGVSDMARVIDRFAREIKTPLMLDSTQPEVIEAGLKLAGGKCIINSVNLEDGEEKLARVARLCRQYGAGVVALTIDEDPVEAMAKSADRKLAIATRIHGLLVGRHGLNEEDIFWDCLTFPITTGVAADRRLALETLDGIERVMRRFPRCQSTLGVSNVSFGLQPAARVVLNSVFLREACDRGLTAAIVHAGKILPRTLISDERWNAALDLIYDRREAEDPLERFLALFAEGEQLGEKERAADLPVEERLKRRIIDGRRPGLESDLDEALTRYPPLEIINSLLLDGMKVVGELFGAGQMQLPFVLKSAETMKAAVAYLEPRMDRLAGASRGKIVLATVRGDVHDIGKNLVDIILTNNGFTVYNLGIKQPIANIISAFREHGADAIGLSGLLVKSTLVMRDDLLALNEQGLAPPVILGGAALTRNYVEDDLRPLYGGPLYYAKDAFDGLRLMTELKGARRAAPSAVVEQASASVETLSPAAAVSQPEPANHPMERRNLEKLDAELQQRYGLREIEEEALTPAAKSPRRARVEGGAEGGQVATDMLTAPRSGIRYEHAVPTPPFWGARVVERIPLKAVLGYINETMLFQVQWGYRKKGRNPEEWKRYVNAEIRPHYRELALRCEQERILQPAAIYGYWPCSSDGADLVIYAPPRPGAEREPVARFAFPRQKRAPYWCLSDFWRPLESGESDVIALSLVTAGSRVSEVAREWFAKNEYQQYLFLHGLGVETAEALAEYIHKQVRAELGVGDRDERDLQRLFKQGYQGSRFSFGYPACPNLEDQTQLLHLLGAERIGVTLSEEFQLEPEQSTSAVITIHPEARYFNAR